MRFLLFSNLLLQFFHCHLTPVLLPPTSNPHTVARVYVSCSLLLDPCTPHLLASPQGWRPALCDPRAWGELGGRFRGNCQHSCKTVTGCHVSDQTVGLAWPPCLGRLANCTSASSSTVPTEPPFPPVRSVTQGRR